MYHVLSRGNERRDVFTGDDDRQLFLDTLGEISDRLEVDICAYGLMGNHYHLLLRTRRANLSKAMQWLGDTYTNRFNLRHGRSGHLFQGRFKSMLVQNDAYLLRVLSVITQGFLVGRLAEWVREDILIVSSVAMMAVSLVGWTLASSVVGLLLVLIPTSLSGGVPNTMLSSTLTKAVDPQEIGGILGLSASIESSTRILAPIVGSALLQQLGTGAPGAFGALTLAGLLIYVLKTIYNHEIVHTFGRHKSLSTTATS